MKKFIILCTILSLHAQAKEVNEINKFEDKEFLCKPTNTVMFTYNKVTESWSPTTVKLKELVIRMTTGLDTIPYMIQRSGQDFPLYFCDKGINQYGFLNCGEIGILGKNTNTRFRFNAISKRYIMWSPNGYYNVLPEKERLARVKNSMNKFSTTLEQALMDYPTDENSDIPRMEIGTCKQM